MLLHLLLGHQLMTVLDAIVCATTLDLYIFFFSSQLFGFDEFAQPLLTRHNRRLPGRDRLAAQLRCSKEW